MRKGTGAVVVAIVASAVLAAQTTRAKDVGPEVIGDDLRAEAQAHRDRGKQFFADGDFMAAAVEFHEAGVLLAPVAVNPDGTVKDRDAHELRRYAIADEATAYSQANLPVEALDAFVTLRDRYGGELPVLDRQNVDEAIVKLRARIGTIELRGLPRDVSARIDGRAVPPEAGTQPFRIAAGEHVLLAEGHAYKPFEDHFTVVAGAPAVVDVKLVPSDTPARIRIESTIEPAEITIDGVKRGPAPVELEIAPGAHDYLVTSEQHRPMEGSFTATPGERSVVKVSLIPRRNPLGLRLESYSGAYLSNRDDTPLGKFAVGFGLRFFHEALRYAGVELGLDYAQYTRDLDRFSFGTVLQWCPDRFRFRATQDRRAQWCPINVGALLTIGGKIGPFTGGDRATRLSTGFELRFEPMVFRLAGGIGTEPYKRSAIVDLSVGVTYLEFSVGFDL
jgi:hypothetical protein